MKNDIHTILIRPHITEKATITSEAGVYVFEIAKDATKTDVSRAIKSLYKVTPVQVRTVTTPAKRLFVRGKRGASAGNKKAYVYLKKGDTIEIM
jgi:large subunit ribosomal protein L23